MYNYADALVKQQSGFGEMRGWDIALKRLHCLRKSSFNKLLPRSDTDDLVCDAPIFACKFSPNNGSEHLVALANEEGNFAVHNCENSTRFGVQAHNNAIFDLAWMFNELKIVTASGDHTAKLHDVGEGDVKEIRTFFGHTRSVKTVAFRRDDPSVFATGGRDGNIIIWDTRSDTSNIIGKADRTIFSSHDSKVWTPKRRVYTPTKASVKSVTSLVFQDDNNLVSCGAGDGVIKIWDLRKNYYNYKKACPKATIPYSGKTCKNGFSCLTVDHNSLKLYASCLDNTIYCYNLATYNTEPIFKYNGHQNNSFYIKSCLSKDGDYLVSGSSDENAYIWNTKLQSPIIRLPGHIAEVTCVSWSLKQDLTLITCSDDMTHKLWLVGSEELLDDSELEGGFKAEVLPLNYNGRLAKLCLKRANNEQLLHMSAKLLIIKCNRCGNVTKTTKHNIECCDECLAKFSVTKRLNDEEICNENKRFQTEFGPRRLFANLNQNTHQNECQEHLAQVLDKDKNHEDYLYGSRINDENSHTGEKTKLNPLNMSPSTNRLNRLTINSPTMNLPNFVVDGTAPHLNYSPPKRKSQDWLTKMRIEMDLRREMHDKTVGPSSPKSPRLDLTPSRGRKSSMVRSPLLRFFKVTNSSLSKTDGHCCPNKTHNCTNFTVTNPSSSQ